MKIQHLEIKNFRAIEHVDIESESSMVVIAGPNGCGKSCVLDAIRLAKSAYGGYDPNEYKYWLGEFQIDPNSPADMRKVLRNKSVDAYIRIALSLHASEADYLRSKADDQGERSAVSTLMPGVSFEEWRQRIQATGQQSQQIIKAIEAFGKQLAKALKAQLRSPIHQGTVSIKPDGTISLSPNIVLQSVWSIYEPQSIGIVDYHGPQRHFSRESLGGVNLSLKTQEQGQKKSVLYNYANKYANIKTQMATEYVLSALQQQAGVDSPAGRQLLGDTLKELFRKFFPGKEFRGVTANEEGELEFAVTLSGAEKHDINDLSSGEKEILFGYLRLRNNAQRHSIIMLDEPELHLNPKLIQGLPQFYEQHVAIELENQIWTVTHSDAFLREAISSSGTKVFHMREASSQLVGQNQIQEISGRKEEESAILELIGDIAGYRPGGKVVVFEGEGSEFDRRMTAKLFPSYDRKMNFVSGGNKPTVRRLHEVLDAQAGRPRRTFSIVDNDDATQEDADEERGMYTWDVYHIENYLLEPGVIMSVLERASLSESEFDSETEVEEALRLIAEEHVEELVEVWVRRRAYGAIRSAIRLKDGTRGGEPANKVGRKVAESAQRISHLVKTELSPEELKSVADERRNVLRSALKDSGEWKKAFRGRDILKTFASRYAQTLGYQPLRDMIVNEMSQHGIVPRGMHRVMKAIDSA